MELNKIAKWLENHGIKYDFIVCQDKSKAIMVANDYDGICATKEVFAVFSMVKTYIHRYYKNFMVEPRGAYSGILIRKDGEM